ncbi:NAD(P)H-dependent flavin oxidoreductase [Tessaracoccus palaemonis]|uniref:Nitronate monooxygenase n=1 Tax=Tessaracoccus palaemonis TaxID=2829499 RepID=A0ABX8SHG0_9ACTN|nr:nitronate monooxygenase [Tessaracoccus palaemonis]QXT62299.1 nitronate monooxygenase [Tessaracoccus palaemonis]
MALPERLTGLRLPVVAAPMFLVSGPDLVLACAHAGVLGSFPALNRRTTGGFDEWLALISAGARDAPYAVNLIVHSSNPRLDDDLEVIARRRVPVVITSLGASDRVVAAVHAYGGLVFHDVTTLAHARRAIAAGVDGLILVSAGAGGHAGTLNPFSFVTAVRSFYDGTLLLGGGLSTGADVAAAIALGADLAYLGTRFVATQESLAPQEYKDMLAAAAPEDIVYTPTVSSIPANFLAESLTRAGIDPAAPPGPVDLTHLTSPSPSDAKAWRDIWSAGQSVAGITDTPSVAQLVYRLDEEYAAAVKRLRRHP